MLNRAGRQVMALTRPPLEPLEGRLREVESLVELLSCDAHLVTITGTAGVGKSRLAWEVVQRVVADGRFEGGVWCDVHGVSSPEGCRDALMQASGLVASTENAAADAIGTAFDGIGQLLIVLDGLDAVVDQAGGLLEGLMTAAASARWLVTSRRVLRLGEESVFELQPLEVPPGDVPEGPAADFFLRRARKVRTGYTPTAQEAPFVAALVRELDGLPLALQLAAPRLAVMGPSMLLHRLRASRSMLQARGGSVAAGHKSFDMALQGSWQSLTDPERACLSQLAAFPGSIAVEAAEAVVARAMGETQGVVELLQALRERSLLAAEVMDDGSLRLKMLRGVRNFVLRNADAKLLAEATRRHAEYFAIEAERHHEQRGAAGGAQARRWLDAERENLVGVVRGVMQQSERVTALAAEPALRVLLALGPGHGEDSPAVEFASLLEVALDATRDSGADPILFGRALALRGDCRRLIGRIPAATKDLLQALQVARTLRAPELEGSALLAMGRLLADRGELEPARDHLQKAIAAFDVAEARAQQASAWVALADLEARQHRFDTSRALLERAVALFARLGDNLAEGAACRELVRVLLHEERRDEAIATLARCRSLASEQPSSLASIACDLLDNLAQHDAGALQQAMAGYERVAMAARRVGAITVEGEALAWQALASAESGAAGHAHALFRGALDTHGLGRDRALWLVIARAVDACSAPGTALDAVHDATEMPPAPAMQGFVTALRATTPATWLGQRPVLEASGRDNLIGRLTLRALDSLMGASASTTPAVPENAIVVGHEGRWFRMPGEEPVSLERRRPLARILARLAEARETGVEPPALPWDALQEAGWPGERILAEAGAHRVRVAVSTLRKLGLRDALKTAPEGYCLDPARVVVRLDAPLGRS